MRNIDIKLGNKSYLLRELPIRQNRIWRERFNPFMAEASAAIEAMSGKDDVEAVKSITTGLIDVLSTRIDEVVELVFLYSEKLEAERELIETTATEREMLDAFIKIIGVAYPIDFLAEKMAGLWKIGLQQPPTLTNSASQLGESGPTN